MKKTATTGLGPDSDTTVGAPEPPAQHRTFARLAADLRPEVRLLAEHVTASEPKAILLSFFRHQPRTALTSGDVAALVDLPLAVVAAALTEWMTTGLIECQSAGDLIFYRLTSDPERLQALAELVAWRERWVASLWRVAHEVDPRIHEPLVWNGHLVPTPPSR